MGWLYSDNNASLSSNWTELDWTGTELGKSVYTACEGHFRGSVGSTNGPMLELDPETLGISFVA